MGKNRTTICEGDLEIYYSGIICSISVGVIFRKGSIEISTLACDCKHVHIRSSWIQVFGYFLFVALQVWYVSLNLWFVAFQRLEITIEPYGVKDISIIIFLQFLQFSDKKRHVEGGGSRTLRVSRSISSV